MRHQDSEFLTGLAIKALNETAKKETQGQARRVLFALNDGGIPDQHRLWRDVFLGGLIAAADARCTLPRLGKHGGQRLLSWIDVRMVAFPSMGLDWYQSHLSEKAGRAQRYLLALAVAKEASDFVRFALQADERGVTPARIEGGNLILPGETFVLYANRIFNAMRNKGVHMNHLPLSRMQPIHREQAAIVADEASRQLDAEVGRSRMDQNAARGMNEGEH